MRTTVTFDPDVYAKLKRLGKNQDFKPFVNEVLRTGLAVLEGRRNKEPVAPAELPVFVGNPIVHDLDNVHRILEELDSSHAG